MKITSTRIPEIIYFYVIQEKNLFDNYLIMWSYKFV